jgi:predicted cupin superfamily sugar epimerase
MIGGIDFNRAGLTAAKVRDALAPHPHPEGGCTRETWRDPGDPPGRGAASLFLLAQGEISGWHRVDAAEIWLWHAGAGLQLNIAEAGGIRTLHLGPGFDFQAVVPVLAWQTARSAGGWSLVSCVVAPAFDFAGFELVPAGALPADRSKEIR